MATITYRGLSGTRATLTVNTTDTFTTITNAAIADEGLNSDYYADFFLLRDNSVLLSTDGAQTYAQLNLTADDELVAVLADDPATFTKQQRQVRKLEIAAVQRTADSRPNTYDITQLPTQYDGNDVVDNANSGGLIVGRPWATSAVTALFTSLGAEFEIRVDDTTGISPGMIMTGMDYGGATVTVVTVNSSTSLEMSIIAPDTVPASGTVLTFTNP